MSLNSQAQISSNISMPDSIPNLGKVLAVHIKATVSATDDTGLIIDNIQPGDLIQIYSGSGIASFKESDMKMLKGILGLANAVAEGGVLYASDGAAAPFLQTWGSAVKNLEDAFPNKVSHAKRDFYGQDPGTKDFAKDEGGVIICMPQTRGAVYATSDMHFKDGAKKQGRQRQFYSDAALHRGVFFPCRENPASIDAINPPGGILGAKATTAGSIQILAFDSNFSDNAGFYHIDVMVVRNYSSAPTNVGLLASKMALKLLV